MKTVVWKPVEYEGMEYLMLADRETIHMAHSVVICAEKRNAFRLDYQVLCDRNYVVRHVQLHIDSDSHLYLERNEYGTWSNDIVRIGELEGCIDVDITATPFTNTLPIRRIDWKVGQSETLKMAYITVPELTLSVNRQRYTCLEKSADGAKFRFESVDSDFTAVITVDADGLVLDYPGLFRRVV
jgi:hypothetical protein